MMSTQEFNVMTKEEFEMAKKMRYPLVIGTDEKGNQIVKWISGTTMQELLSNAMQFGSPQKEETKADSPMFMEYAWKWFYTFHEPKVRENVAKNAKIILNKHLKPYFKNMKLGDISTTDVQNFFNTKRDLSHSTCQKLQIYMNQIFESAIEDGIIMKNPTKSKRITYSNIKTERKALDQNDALDVLNNLHKLEPIERLIIGITLLTGVRRGEVLGLRWEDFDFDSNLLEIKRAVIFRNNHPVVSVPKSESGYRFIPISADLRKLLDPLKKDSGFIFVRENGELLSETTFKRMMDRINKKIDLHGATLHVLRHTFVTTALEAGTDIKTLQEMAGHSDVQVTLDVYAHARKNKIVSEGKKLSGMYKKG